mmetsp:Transcript_46671/g.84220  ORF Transcript_46671/g.84220 Transcript_46671/m.84220 type:complete len:340 (+) Transcript_46671:2-1021(+)
MAVVVLLFSLVAFSSFVASISTSMTALRNMNNDINKQFWLLRRFLKQNKVASPVASRIIKYLEFTVNRHQERLEVGSVKLLGFLSDGLLKELQYEMTYVKLTGHPLFQVCVTEFEPFMVQVCAMAVKTVKLAAGDVLFNWKDVAQYTYFLVHGDVEYTWNNAKKGIRPRLKNFEWIAEAALWMSWTHCGRCHARHGTEMLLIDPVIFIQLASRFVDTFCVCKQYAQVFFDSFQEEGAADIFRCPEFYDSVTDAIRAAAMSFSVDEPLTSSADPDEKTKRRTGAQRKATVGQKSRRGRSAARTGVLRGLGTSNAAASGAASGIHWIRVCQRRKTDTAASA